MDPNPSRRTVLGASGALAVGLAGCVGSDEEPPEEETSANGEDGDTNPDSNPDERTLEWGGQGSGFATQDCPDQLGFWKWILTPGGQPSIQPDPVPELTVTFEDGTTTTVEGELRPGGSGAVQFQVFREDGGTVESAEVTFSGGGRNPILTISEGNCVEDEEPPELEVITLDATGVNAESATLQGELLTLGGFDEVEVFFRSKAVDDEDYQETASQTLTEPGTFNAEVTELATGTDYEFFAVARGTNDEEVTVSGDLFGFEKAEPDESDVETKPATKVNESTATLNGFLSDLGEFESVEAFFEWRVIGDEEFQTTESQTLTEIGSFSAEIEGLEDDTEYEFRAVLDADGERFEGDFQTFTKDAEDPKEPKVQTKPASDVNKSSATLNGKLTTLGDFDTVHVFFQYRVLGDEAWESTEPQERMDSGSFSEVVEELDRGTTYEFRAVVSANDGTFIGEIKRFTKDDKKKPDVERDLDVDVVKKTDKTVTLEVSNDTKHELKLSWRIDDSKEGGKLTVPAEDTRSFEVEYVKKTKTVSVYFDGDQVASREIDPDKLGY